MRYRVANEQDYPAIRAFLDRSDYFAAPTHEGGHWVLAEDDDGIRATIWFFAEPPFAFVGYWEGKGYPAIRVAQIAEIIGKSLGVRRAYFNVRDTNELAQKALVKGFGADSDGRNYYVLTKDYE